MSADAHIAVAQYLSQLDLTPDQFQQAALNHLAQGRSVLVCAPTGAGKTLVGEVAVHLAFSSGHRAFYTTPIKALSNQKFHDFVAQFGAENVGLLTGDLNINGDAPIVVMTTEVLRNMLYAGTHRVADLAWVVLDEVHYLADRERGPVWEEVILHLPERVGIVALSATVSNSDELVGWLRTVRGEFGLVHSTFRPVPLHHSVFLPDGVAELWTSGGKVNPRIVRALRPQKLTDSEIESLPGRQRRQHRWEQRRGGPTVVTRARIKVPSRQRVLRELQRADLLPAIVFIFSRAECDRAVSQFLRSELDLTTKEEKKQIAALINELVVDLPEKDLAALGYYSWRAALMRGASSHHAGLLPVYKEVAEKLFVRNLLKVVYATETLALGINMPARAVVLEKLVKWDGRNHVDLKPGEYTQLAGRAGRRGIDDQGTIISLAHPDLDPVALGRLASATSFPLRSAFRPTFNMSVNLIDKMGYTAARDLLETSFAQYQSDAAVVAHAQQSKDLLAEADRMKKALQGIPQDSNKYRRLARRADAKQKQAQSMASRVNARAGSLAKQFAAVSAVLEELGYLDGAAPDYQVSGRGRVLARVYAVEDLWIAQALTSGIWEQYTSQELATAVAAIVCTARNTRNARLSDEVADLLMDNAAVGNALAAVMDRHRVSHDYEIDAVVAGAMWHWAGGASIGDLVTQRDITAGDFVRWAKQTVDVLDQIAMLERDHQLASTARQAINAVRRDVVGYTTNE